MNLMLEEENIALNHKTSTIAEKTNDQPPIVKIENLNDDLGNILLQTKTIQSISFIEINDSDDEGRTTSSTQSEPIVLRNRRNSVCPSIDGRPFDSGNITQVKKEVSNNDDGINIQGSNQKKVKATANKRIALAQESNVAMEIDENHKTVTARTTSRSNARSKSTRTKRFKCQLCDYATSEKCNLKRHINTHTGVKLFHCEICMKDFTQNQTLKRHLEYVHKSS